MGASYMTKSFELADRLFSVWYKNADAYALRADCADWLENVPTYEKEVRRLFKGDAMLPGQLDLLDKAKERVRSVLINCQSQL